MAQYRGDRQRRRPSGNAGTAPPRSSIAPQRVEAFFDGYRTLALDTATLHQWLQAAFGDRESDPNLLFAIAGRAGGSLGVYHAQSGGRRWVCLLHRTTEQYSVMIAIPVVRNVLPVICVQGATEHEARETLDRFVAALQ